MPRFCEGCGRPPPGGAHAECERRLRTEPARYCAVCGFRMDVQVYPDHVEASCRECRRRARSARPSRSPSRRPSA